jgi:hypothetical protein
MRPLATPVDNLGKRTFAVRIEQGRRGAAMLSSSQSIIS